MTKYMMLWNDGVYHESRTGRNCFSKEELVDKLNNLSDDENLLDEDGDVVDFDRLLSIGGCGEKVEIWNEDIVEMGDEFVSVSIVEVEE